MVFLATWGCASDFLKMLPKFKIAILGELQIFFVYAKTQNLKSEIIQILQSHSPRYGDVQVIFLKGLARAKIIKSMCIDQICKSFLIFVLSIY